MIQAAQNSAFSALKAISTRINSNANNIANSNTDGFKRTRVSLAATEGNTVVANVERIEAPGESYFSPTSEGLEHRELSNVDLTRELPEMNLNSTMYKANLKTLQVTDEMTGELLKLKA